MVDLPIGLCYTSLIHLEGVAVCNNNGDSDIPDLPDDIEDLLEKKEWEEDSSLPKSND